MSKIYNLRMFFYERGSVDYPLNHGIDERFGFNTSSEITGMFNYTMKDIYTNVNDVHTIENLYKLTESTYNDVGLDKDYDAPEKISVIVTDPGKMPELPLNPTDEEKLEYNNQIENYNNLKALIESIDVNSGGSTEDAKHSLFWRKMFVLFELLKKYEKQIATGNMYHESISVTPFDTVDNSKLNPFDIDILDEYSTNFSKWFSMIIGRGAGYQGRTATQQESGSYIRDFDYPTEADKLWYSNDDTSIQITTGPSDSAIMSPSDIYNSRIEKMTFTVRANLPTRLPGSTDPVVPGEEVNSIYTFNFSLYFVPDIYVTDEYNSNYTVYTYNDDMSEKWESEGFDRNKYNIYDNDYAGALLPVGDPNRNKLIVNSSEFDNLIIGDITNIMSSGIYTGYKLFTTVRVSPEIVDGKVVWDDINHTTIQKFYVFHTNPDTSVDIPNGILQDQVRRYLINLHSNCKPQSYDAEGNVTYIGHGVESVQDITGFLANMYPNLFETTVISIIPSSYMLMTSPTVQERLVPSNYRHPVTASDINDIVQEVYPEYNLTPNVQADTSLQAGYIELFSLGLTSGQADPSVSNPVFQLVSYISKSSGTTDRPITGIKGFEDYRPKFFIDPPPDSSVVDKFQYILMKLYMNAFVSVEGGNYKPYYASIMEVPIKYSVDPNYNGGVSTTNGGYNLAEFIINNINYSVYCVKYLNFGDPNGNPIEG